MRIVIADDHSIVRMALKHVLGELDLDAVAVEASDGVAAQEAIAAAPCALVLTDLYMPNTGPDYLSRLVAVAKGAPVAVFTISEDPAVAQNALHAGVRAFIPKSTNDRLLISILRLVLAGGQYLPPPIALLGDGGAAAAALRPTVANEPLPTGHTMMRADLAPLLTPRQYQVLQLMAEGLSNADIGTRLGLNLSTVKSHVTGILRALNVINRTQAVLAYRRDA